MGHTSGLLGLHPKNNREQPNQTTTIQMIGLLDHAVQ